MGFSQWWRRQRLQFTRSYQDARLRRALAREQRRTLSGERRRAQRAASGESKLKLAYQRFQIWNHKRSEQSAREWARRRERYGWLAWLQKKQGWIIALFFLALMAVFAAFLFRETYRPKRGRGPALGGNEPAVVVNGRRIPMGLYIQSLEMAHGPAVLQRLTEQEAIRQEAERLKLSLSPEERIELKERFKNDPQGAIHLPEAEAEILLRQIIGKETDKARKTEVFETFKKDLTIYTLRGMRFESRAKADGFVAALRNGVNPAEAGKKFSQDGGMVSALGSLTLGDIREQFGPATAEALSQLEVGQITPPLTNAGGFAIYQIAERKASFDDVQPAIDNILVEAERAKVMHRILSKAKIDSPYLEENLLAPTTTPTPTSQKRG